MSESLALNPEKSQNHSHSSNIPEGYFLKKAKEHWRNYLKRNWVMYSTGVFMVIATALLQVSVTRIIGWVLDFFTGDKIPSFFLMGSQEKTFYWLFGLLFAARVLLFVTRMGWRLTLARETHRASSELKEAVWDTVRYFKQADLMTKFTKGILMNANTSDVGRGRFIYGFTLVAICDMLFLGLFTLVTMILINAKLALISVGVLLVLPNFVRKLANQEMNKYREAQENLGTFNDLTSQVVSTIRLQRITQTGQFWFKRMMDSAENYRLKRLDAVFTSLRYIPTMGSGSLLSYIILFALGIPYVINGQMTIGDFVAMQGLIFLLQDPLAELGFIISEWKKSFTSLERLAEIFHNEKDPHLSHGGDHGRSEEVVLEAENLSFKYFDGEEYVLKNMSFELRQGERLGVTGAIGSGKSTLVKLLSGIERGHEGEIRFHAIPYRDYGHGFLRQRIGLVPQKPFLFADTIRENIKLDRKLSDEEVWHYLELACLADDVRGFPDGLDTPLGEWGINLSGGQKQRLTLARALARDCEIYFFDDCLSAVDTVTEEKILGNLNATLKEKTLVWVAHRDSTLKYCDRVEELSNGEK